MPEGPEKEERSYSATPRRREEARKKGQVAKSPELTSVFMFLVGLVSLRFVFPSIFHRVMNLSKNIFSALSVIELDTGSLYLFVFNSLLSLAKCLAPFAIVMLGSALLINCAQVGFLITGETLSPKFDRIDPIKGFRRLISKRTIVSMAEALLKLIIVGYVSYITLKSEQGRILSMFDMQISPAISEIIRLVFKVGFRVSILLFVLAIFDYAYQRWEYERSLRMTRQELREEMKHTEGDPLIKSRIRSIQRQIAMRRMMQAVPTADVVITNPTHIAVALEYKGEVDLAPKVCAKGKRKIAEKIIAIAREHNIPIIEDRPLAHALYKVELGKEIPPTLYKAVAEILAKVYQMNRTGSLL